MGLLSCKLELQVRIYLSAFHGQNLRQDFLKSQKKGWNSGYAGIADVWSKAAVSASKKDTRFAGKFRSTRILLGSPLRHRDGLWGEMTTRYSPLHFPIAQIPVGGPKDSSPLITVYALQMPTAHPSSSPTSTSQQCTCELRLSLPRTQSQSQNL